MAKSNISAGDGSTAGRYWRQRTDEELLRTQFITHSPETVDALVLDVPVGDEEPIVEMWYDFRGSKRDLIRCAHCKYPNHKAGFVIRSGDKRFLCGHDCGEKLYGANFLALHKDFTSAKERAGHLHRMRNLHAALPAFLSYLFALRTDDAFAQYSATRQEIIRRMPRLRGAVCTENLNPDIVVVKPAKDRA